MKPSQLTKRIEELSEKLKPTPSEGIKIAFQSFTEPEQLILLKNFELDEKYLGKWTHEAILENKELILKGNHIFINRITELFIFAMPRAMMLDEVEQILFRINFWCFMQRWLECKKNVRKWSKKDREDFLRDMKVTESKNHKIEAGSNGKENND